MQPHTPLAVCLFALFALDSAAAVRFDALVEDMRAIWHGPDAAFKLLPCYHYIHPFVEVAGSLGVAAEGGEAITFQVPVGAAPVICEPWEARLAPPTPHAARWSLPIVVAARLVEGQVDLLTFEQPASDAVLALAARSRWEPMADAGFPGRFAAAMDVRTRDGRLLRGSVPDVRGGKTRPVADAHVRAKFDANAIYAVRDPAAVAAALLTLKHAANLNPLRAALEAIP